MASTDDSLQSDLSLLATNTPHLSSEAHLIRARLEDRKENRRCLDAHIESLEIQIQGLRSERETAQKSCEVLESLLAPIRKMPPEVLGEAFVYCVQPEANSFDISESAPLIISRVCRTWRKVASDTPRLWTTLKTGTFNTPHKPMPLPNPRAIEMWLRNSKACDLSITFQPGPTCEFYRNKPGFIPADPNRVREILQLFRKHLPRLRALRISMDRSMASWLIPHDNSTVLNRLEKALFFLWELGGTLEDPYMLMIDAPVLTDLEILNLTVNAGTRVPSLRTFTSNAPPNTVLSFLPLCPLLERLDWWPSLWWEEVDPSEDPIPAVTIPSESLQILSISDFDPFTLVSVLDGLTGALPALKVLLVEDAGLDEDGMSVSMSVSFGSSLSRLSSLENLCISGGFIDEGFFQAMASPTPASPPPCPHLSRIELRGVSFPIDHLIQFIRDRARPLDTLPGQWGVHHLTHVILQHQSQLEPHHLNAIRELRTLYDVHLNVDGDSLPNCGGLSAMLMQSPFV